MRNYCESCPIDGDAALETMRAAILDAFVRGLDLPSQRGADAVTWWEPKSEARNVFRCGAHVPNSRGRRAWSLAVNGGHGRTMEYVNRPPPKGEHHVPWRLVVGVESEEAVPFAEWVGSLATARITGTPVPAPPAGLDCDISRLVAASRHEPPHQVGTDRWHLALRP